MDYVSLAVSRLTSQFGNSPKLKAFVEAMVGPLTTVEQAADDLREQRWIDTAVGAQLDGVGYIVGELRQGRTDDEYRLAIRFRVFINISKGTPGDLINGLHFLTAPTDAQYMVSYPASAMLFTDGYYVGSSIQAAIQDLSPAAISQVPVMVSFQDKPFRFAREAIPGELFVNGDADYLTAQGSDIQVSQGGVLQGSATLGGVVPAELDVGLGYLDLGGPTLAVYNPNTLNTLGHDNLTGVFQ